jgi:hypothetical protein
MENTVQFLPDRHRLEHVLLDEPETGITREVRKILPRAGHEVVEDDDLGRRSPRVAVGQVRAQEPRALPR